MKTIGINHASKFIPMMIEVADEWIANVKKNETIDLTIEMKRITFRVISKILFGTDIDKMEETTYINPYNGEILQLSFEDLYFKYSKDEMESFYLPINRILPFLSRYRLINPFKTNFTNNISLKNSLRTFLTKSTDTSSVYMQVNASEKFNSEDVLLDMLGLLFAGFDTSSFGLSSMLYNLKKYPLTMEKLKSELKKYNLVDLNIKEVNLLKESYEK